MRGDNPRVHQLLKFFYFSKAFPDGFTWKGKKEVKLFNLKI